MEVSSSTQSSSSNTVSKPLDTQGQQVLKLLESAAVQSKQVSAQKTGIGGNINITG